MLTKSFRVFVSILFLSSVILASRLEAETAREIAHKTLPSVVLLLTEDANGQMLSLGSGFFVKENIIVTNFHVIKGAHKGYVKPIGQKTKYLIDGIVGIDNNRDLAILAVTGLKGKLLHIEDSSKMMVGDEVFVAGNPLGLEGTFSQGIISGIRKIGNDSIFQITAPISPGSSGGPVLNSQGKIIGVAVATFKDGQNLNFAIPSLYLTSLLSNIKPVVQLFTIKILKIDKQVINTLGRSGIEGVIGSQFRWDRYDQYSQTGGYSISIHNKLNKVVKNIHCLVVFHDNNHSPIDFDSIHYQGIIPPGAAKRVQSKVNPSIQKITQSFGDGRVKEGIVKFRILQFEIEE